MTLPAHIVEERPLVAKEQAMWLLRQYSDEDGVLDVAFALESVDGRLDLAALRTAVDVVVARHPALRTRFPDLDGEPRRIVLAPDAQASANIVRVAEVAEDEVAAALLASASAPLDLADGPPIQVSAVISPTRRIVCVTVDHLVYDAFSTQIVRRDLAAAYAALIAGRPIPAELNTAVVGPAIENGTEASLRFWADVLAGARPSHDLDLGRPADRATGFPGGVARARVDPPAWAAAEQLARQLSCPLSAVALAAFATVLHRHGAGDDLVFGLPTYNRGRPPHEAVGYYTCIQPIRVSLAGAPTFGDLVRMCARTMLEGLEYADTSLDEIAPHAYEPEAASHRPLVRYLFNYVADMPQIASDTAWADVALTSARSRMELDLAFARDTDGITLRAIYAADVFDAADVTALQHRVQAILVAAAAADVSIADLPMASPDDLDLLDRSSASPAPSQFDAAEDIATSAFADAGAPAFVPVTDSGPVRSYGDLAATVDALAGALRDGGVEPGATIGLRTTSFADTLVAVLACWLVEATADLDGTAPVDVCLGDGGISVEYRPGGDQTSVWERAHPDDIALRFTDEHGERVDQTHQSVADAVAAVARGLTLSAGDALATSDGPRSGPALIAALATLGRGGRVFSESVAVPPVTSTVWLATPERAGRALDAPRPPGLTRIGLHSGQLPAGLTARAAELEVKLARLYGPVAPDGLCVVSAIEPGAGRGFIADLASARVVDQHGQPTLPRLPGVLEVAGRRGSVAAPARLTAAGIELVADEPAAPSSDTTPDTTLARRSPAEPTPTAPPAADATSIQSGPTPPDSTPPDSTPSDSTPPDSVPSDSVASGEASTTLGDVDIVELWRAVLGRDDIGPNDNFFVLGGDSLQAAKVIGQLKKRTGLRISLRTAFKNPTPVRFVEAVRTAHEGAISAL